LSITHSLLRTTSLWRAFPSCTQSGIRQLLEADS
jgi:hypothetical protein